mgnify:CR=1 FL=1
MTTTQYKNWKSEIAWLRRLAKKCHRAAAVRGTMFNPGLMLVELDKTAESLEARADSLEKAKGTAQSS